MKLKFALPSTAAINSMPRMESIVADTTHTVLEMSAMQRASIGAMDNRTLEDIGVPRADIIAKARTRRRAVA